MISVRGSSLFRGEILDEGGQPGGKGEMIDGEENQNRYQKWAIAARTKGSVKEIVGDEKGIVRWSRKLWIKYRNSRVVYAHEKSLSPLPPPPPYELTIPARS